jgi:hypothetical protein
MDADWLIGISGCGDTTADGPPGFRRPLCQGLGLAFVYVAIRCVGEKITRESDED